MSRWSIQDPSTKTTGLFFTMAVPGWPSDGAAQVGDTADMAEKEEASTVVAEHVDPACVSHSLSPLVCQSACLCLSGTPAVCRAWCQRTLPRPPADHGAPPVQLRTNAAGDH